MKIALRNTVGMLIGGVILVTSLSGCAGFEGLGNQILYPELRVDMTCDPGLFAVDAIRDTAEVTEGTRLVLSASVDLEQLLRRIASVPGSDEVYLRLDYGDIAKWDPQSGDVTLLASHEDGRNNWRSYRGYRLYALRGTPEIIDVNTVWNTSEWTQRTLEPPIETLHPSENIGITTSGSIVDLTKSKPCGTIRVPTATSATAFNRSGNMLAVTKGDGEFTVSRLYIWDLLNDVLLANIKFENGWATAIDFGEVNLAVANGSEILLFDASRFDALRSITVPSNRSVSALALSEHESVVFVGTINGLLFMYSSETGQLLQTEDVHNGASIVTITQDDFGHVITASGNGIVNVWSLE
jgi:WD40 repeat protein